MTGSVTGSFGSTLSSTGVMANTYGNATTIPVFAVDAKWRFPIVTITAITGAAPTGTAGGDLTSTYSNPKVAANAIDNRKISAAAAIVDTKRATISTRGKVSNSATTAKSANTTSATVSKDNYSLIIFKV